ASGNNQARFCTSDFGFRISDFHLVPSHFELFSQNPMEQGEQSKCRHNQNGRVESKHADFDPEVLFLCAKEDIRPIAAAVIALLHLGVRDQIGDLLVYIDLLGCNRASRILEKGAVEWPLAIQNLINQAEIMVEFVGGLCLQSGKQSERFL